MNIYRHTFNARCPNNDASIRYELEIRAGQTIMVEDIVKVCATIHSGYHEDIADALIARLGASQTLRAHHHGVDIETTRVAE